MLLIICCFKVHCDKIHQTHLIAILAQNQRMKSEQTLRKTEVFLLLVEIQFHRTMVTANDICMDLGV